MELEEECSLKEAVECLPAEVEVVAVQESEAQQLAQAVEAVNSDEPRP